MINKESRIFDVLRTNPDLAEVFQRFGMGCAGCMGMMMETIENGAKMHNISVEQLLAELNRKENS